MVTGEQNAEPLPSAGSSNGTGVEQQTINFADATAPVIVPSISASLSTRVPSQSFADYLARPVTITEFEWNGASSYGNQIKQHNPWKDWLMNPAVQNKLQNFQLLKGDLKVRFMLNGSPFHFGALLAWYRPYYSSGLSFGAGDPHAAIQHPSVFLYPSGHTVAEMTLPFVSMKKFIDLSPNGYTGNIEEACGYNLGYLNYTVFAALLNANSYTSQQLTVTVMAWMEDAELAVPTPYPVVLESDVRVTKKKRKQRTEYDHDGPVSGIASTVAEIASSLTSAPYIGRFARATEIGADAVGAVASLFGWSKPTNIDKLTYVKSLPFSYMAQGVASDASQKLTLDPRAETTVDPAVVGLRGEDSMLISNILSRESLYEVIDFPTTATVGTKLHGHPVCPGIYKSTQDNGVTKLVNTTPMFWLTRAFYYWSGTIKYKIRVVATHYHRGRVRVVYFPRSNAIVPSVDYSNISWNTIIDVSEDSEIEIEIPWTQAVPWLPCTGIDSSAGTPPDFGVINGSLGFYVLNTLESPNGGGSIKFILTAVAGDDFRVAKPYTAAIQNLTPFGAAFDSGAPTDTPVPPDLFEGIPAATSSPYVKPTSGYWDDNTIAPVRFESGASRHVIDNTHYGEEHFGETIVSLRTLLKRICPWYEVTSGIPNNPHFDYILPQMPFDQMGLQATVDGSLTVWPIANIAPGQINAYTYQTFMTYFRTGFLALRGSTRYKIMAAQTTGGADQHMYTSACITDAEAPYAGVDNASAAGACWEGANGMLLNSQHVQDGIEVEVPYYRPQNFVLGWTLNNQSAGMGVDYSTLTSPSNLKVSHDFVTLDGGVIPTCTFIGTAAGEDFTMDWFLCSPPMIMFHDPTGNRSRNHPHSTL
jgi:hypothetical protein